MWTQEREKRCHDRFVLCFEIDDAKYAKVMNLVINSTWKSIALVFHLMTMKFALCAIYRTLIIRYRLILLFCPLVKDHNFDEPLLAISNSLFLHATLHAFAELIFFSFDMRLSWFQLSTSTLVENLIQLNSFSSGMPLYALSLEWNLFFISNTSSYFIVLNKD